MSEDQLLREHQHIWKGFTRFIAWSTVFVVVTLLLMARVPTSDNPAGMRRLPVPRLLLELGLWFVIHMVVSATLFQRDPAGLHPVALMWLGWCVGVLGLMAIRVVSLPSKIASHLFIGFCGASLVVGFVQAVFWAFESHHDATDVFALMELSPIAGLLQIAVTIAVPVALVRILRSKFASLTTAAEPSIPVETR